MSILIDQRRELQLKNVKTVVMALSLAAANAAYGLGPEDSHWYTVRVSKGEDVLMSGSIAAVSGRATPWEQSTERQSLHGSLKVGQLIVITPSTEKGANGLPAFTRVAFQNSELVSQGELTVGATGHLQLATVRQLSLQNDVELVPGVAWVGTAAEGSDAQLRVEVTLQAKDQPR